MQDCGPNDLCPATATVCGNGVLDPGEECDDGNAVNTDSCKTDCTFAICGDGYVCVGLEECDDGNAVDDDGCSNTCTVN